jgi:hypothetical protein
MKEKITRVIRKSGGSYIAYIKETPSVNTQDARSQKREKTSKTHFS